jgi:hypothetical protein
MLILAQSYIDRPAYNGGYNEWQFPVQQIHENEFAHTCTKYGYDFQHSSFVRYGHVHGIYFLYRK